MPDDLTIVQLTHLRFHPTMQPLFARTVLLLALVATAASLFFLPRNAPSTSVLRRQLIAQAYKHPRSNRSQLALLDRRPRPRSAEDIPTTSRPARIQLAVADLEIIYEARFERGKLHFSVGSGSWSLSMKSDRCRSAIRQLQLSRRPLPVQRFPGG